MSVTKQIKSLKFGHEKKYPKGIQKRQAYDDQEMKLLCDELNKFGNKKFSLIFKLMAHNGLRLNEFVNINWKELKRNGYQMQIPASKNGHTAWFKVPSYLISDLEQYGVDYSYKTIQNIFRQFRIFVKTKNPNFTKSIHAHILRHYFITNGFFNTGSSELVRLLTGHTSTKLIESTYIHSNSNYQQIVWEQANMQTITSLEINELKEQISNKNMIILYLKQKLNENGIDYENYKKLEKRF